MQTTYKEYKEAMHVGCSSINVAIMVLLKKAAIYERKDINEMFKTNLPDLFNEFNQRYGHPTGKLPAERPAIQGELF